MNYTNDLFIVEKVSVEPATLFEWANLLRATISTVKP